MNGLVVQHSDINPTTLTVDDLNDPQRLEEALTLWYETTSRAAQLPQVVFAKNKERRLREMLWGMSEDEYRCLTGTLLEYGCSAELHGFSGESMWNACLACLGAADDPSKYQRAIDAWQAARREYGLLLMHINRLQPTLTPNTGQDSPEKGQGQRISQYPQ